VDVDVLPGLGADADPHLVRLIFRELLDNAWKFTVPRRHAHVQVGAVEEGGQRAFVVRDDGVGFDMAYATHLFGAFQRMHPPGEFAGNGIGLAMVQRLVRRHGGRVWAESQVGKGTAVFFTLPTAGDG
jgi:light-regulated signal transduction histidine kinase (bacteriophytochrome)